MKDVFGDEIVEERRGGPVKFAAIAGAVAGSAVAGLLLSIAPAAGAFAAIVFFLVVAVFVFTGFVIAVTDRLPLLLRAAVQIAVLAILFAPGFVVSEGGVAPAPALFSLAIDGLEKSATASMLVTAAVVSPFVIWRAVRSRRERADA